MRNRLATLLSFIALVAALAFAVLWIRSYWVQDLVSLRHGGRMAVIRSFAGSIVFVSEPGGSTSTLDIVWMTQPDPLPTGSGYVTSLRTFVLARLAPNGYLVTLPHWAAVFACAAIPVARFLTQRRRRRTVVPAFPVSEAPPPPAAGRADREAD